MPGKLLGRLDRRATRARKTTANRLQWRRRLCSPPSHPIIEGGSTLDALGGDVEWQPSEGGVEWQPKPIRRPRTSKYQMAEHRSFRVTPTPNDESTQQPSRTALGNYTVAVA